MKKKYFIPGNPKMAPSNIHLGDKYHRCKNQNQKFILNPIYDKYLGPRDTYFGISPSDIKLTWYEKLLRYIFEILTRSSK